MLTSMNCDGSGAPAGCAPGCGARSLPGRTNRSVAMAPAYQRSAAPVIVTPTFCAADADGTRLPVAPTNDAAVGLRRVRQHREIFEQMAVGIAKVDGRGWHPGEHARRVGRLSVEIERRDAGRAQRARRLEDSGERRGEREMQRRVLRPIAAAPEAEHRAAAPADPEERRATIAH